MAYDRSERVRRFADAGRGRRHRHRATTALAGCTPRARADATAAPGVIQLGFDILRFEDGKIVEHWDVIEPVAPREQWKHDNGKFGFR